MQQKSHLILNVGITLSLLLSALHAQESDYVVNIKIPKVPEVPQITAKVPVVKTDDPNAISNEEILKEILAEKVVIFSDHVAPEFHEKKTDEAVVIKTGDLKNGRVPAYLHCEFLSEEEVKKNLQAAGFKVLKSYVIDKKRKVTSIVFTNKALEDAAAKKDRGFASTLRLSIDKKDKLISISNPIYVMAAFMQKDYDKNLAEKTLAQLRDAFEGLKNSDEIVKFRVLERYQFMEGMPKYEDMVLITKGNNDELLAKAKKSKKVLYEQKLSNGSIILGVELSKRTHKFVKKIGFHNSGLLPYPVLIEGGEAKILDPKYYIAMMYPMLKMSQFMKISTVPGAIGKDIDKIFR
jgi:hypothetical protein